MEATSTTCPICEMPFLEVEVALNRTWVNSIMTGLGSSQLQIRRGKGKWHAFMRPGRAAKGLFCNHCGALTVAPTIDSSGPA